MLRGVRRRSREDGTGAAQRAPAISKKQVGTRRRAPAVPGRTHARSRLSRSARM